MSRNNSYYRQIHTRLTSHVWHLVNRTIPSLRFDLTHKFIDTQPFLTRSVCTNPERDKLIFPNSGCHKNIESSFKIKKIIKAYNSLTLKPSCNRGLWIRDFNWILALIINLIFIKLFKSVNWFSYEYYNKLKIHIFYVLMAVGKKDLNNSIEGIKNLFVEISTSLKSFNIGLQGISIVSFFFLDKKFQNIKNINLF